MSSWSAEKGWAAFFAATVSLFAGIASGIVFSPGDWYRSLAKPPFMPPSWVFVLVWLILYPLLGVAMVAACHDSPEGWSYTLPIINIVISMLFCGMMFALQSTLFGMIITVACFGIGIGLIVQYTTVNHSAIAWGMTIPYVVWTAFASILAVWVYWANTGWYQKLSSRPLKRKDNWMIL